MYKKLLIVGVMVLFIGIGTQPAFANQSYNKNYCEVESLDWPYEIISFIRGYCKSTSWGGGFIHIGPVEIHGDDMQKPLITAITINPLRFIYHTKATHIYASFFIGNSYSVSANHDNVIGIAFGDIEWS